MVLCNCYGFIKFSRAFFARNGMSDHTHKHLKIIVTVGIVEHFVHLIPNSKKLFLAHNPITEKMYKSNDMSQHATDRSTEINKNSSNQVLINVVTFKYIIQKRCVLRNG
jgi:hypothetical protein